MVTGLFIETHTGPPSFAMKISSTRPLRPAPVRASQRSSATKGADFSSQLMDEPAASGPVSPLDSGALRGSLFLTRPSLGDYTATREELLQRANEVLGWVNSGEINLHIDISLPLSNAEEAHRRMEGRQSTGKILLMP